MKVSELGKVAQDVIEIVRLASTSVLNVYHSKLPLGLTSKQDNSPLTQADLLSHQILSQYLKKNFKLPVLSEEGKDELVRLRHDWVWLIDPLDGTKEFLNRNGEFTINVALVYKKRPVLGVIAVPVHNKIFVGIEQQGAFLLHDSKRTTLKCSTTDQLSDARLSVSRSHLHPMLKKLLQQNKVTRFIPQGSALKYCSIAQGAAEASIRKTPLMEWDICAADCILFEAGAILTDLKGERLTYNHQDPIFERGIIASNLSLHTALLQLVQPLT